MLGTVRPGAARRSWWLREALAAEPPELAAAAPSLSGSIAADVVVVGGGYTGLWTAWRLTELEPGARIVLLEADICGGGPSGRNGGFVTGWWDELPTLVERHGPQGALAIARGRGRRKSPESAIIRPPPAAFRVLCSRVVQESP